MSKVNRPQSKTHKKIHLLNAFTANLATTFEQWFSKAAISIMIWTPWSKQQHIYDNGTELIGRNFQELPKSYGVKGQTTTVKNPQANLLVECLHGQLGNHLRTMVFEGNNFYDDLDIMVQAAAYAITATVPSNSPYSPPQLAFGHDIIFCQQVLIDWYHLKQVRQAKANKSNTKENKTRQEHVYHLGNLVLLLNPTYEWITKRKLHPPTEGPYPITEIFINGTVSIRCGHVDEIVSIRRI